MTVYCWHQKFTKWWRYEKARYKGDGKLTIVWTRLMLKTDISKTVQGTRLRRRHPKRWSEKSQNGQDKSWMTKAQDHLTWRKSVFGPDGLLLDKKKNNRYRRRRRRSLQDTWKLVMLQRRCGSCVLIFLNSSDVSSVIFFFFFFLLLYYYLSILAVEQTLQHYTLENSPRRRTAFGASTR